MPNYDAQLTALQKAYKAATNRTEQDSILRQIIALQARQENS
jgi:hypothetical protein